MKKILSKITIVGVVLSIALSSCEKSPVAELEVPGTGATTIELAKNVAVSSTGTTGASTVTVNYIVGEKLFPNKVIPKLTVYYLTNTQTGPTSVSSSSGTRTQLYTATNVALSATPTPVAGAPVVTTIGAYGNANNIVWGLKYTFNLSQIGAGLLSANAAGVTNTRGTSIIIVAQDATNATLAEYTFAISEFGLKTAVQ